MPASGLATTKPYKSRGTRPVRKKAITQIIELQQSAFEMAKDSKVKESIRCFAMRSFCQLQEERRKLEMRPLPKPVDVTKLPGKLARVKQIKASFEDPGPAQATTDSVREVKVKPDLTK